MIRSHKLKSLMFFCWRRSNKKRYISTSMRPYSTKLEILIVYEKESPPTMVTWHNNRVTNKKIYISVSTWLMTTKLNKVMAYAIGPPCTKSYGSLIMWLYVVSWQNKNLQFLKSIWHDKLDRVAAYDMRPTLQKSHQSQ